MFKIDASIGIAVICILLFAVVIASHMFSRHGQALILASASIGALAVVGICTSILLSI